ncbi:MAG: hypothetical protein KGM24_00025 [Elusimicrobia bacterium]|nr:hypothetical protein [Elusimicrobiota bacterium]
MRTTARPSTGTSASSRRRWPPTGGRSRSAPASGRARCEFDGVALNCYVPAGKDGKIPPPPTDAIPYE